MYIINCENTLSYNNGVHSQTGPKSGSVKARQLIYRYSTNTKISKVKKLDMKNSMVKVITIKSYLLLKMLFCRLVLLFTNIF